MVRAAKGGEMKKKIEIELDIPDGYEFVGMGAPTRGSHYYNPHYAEIMEYNGKWENYRTMIFKPIEPPLELETELFVKRGEIDNDEICIQIAKEDGLFAKEDGLCIDTGQVSSPKEARDLAKILNYWAANNRLPERVVVKEGE